MPWQLRERMRHRCWCAALALRTRGDSPHCRAVAMCLLALRRSCRALTEARRRGCPCHRHPWTVAPGAPLGRQPPLVPRLGGSPRATHSAPVLVIDFLRLPTRPAASSQPRGAHSATACGQRTAAAAAGRRRMPRSSLSDTTRPFVKLRKPIARYLIHACRSALVSSSGRGLDRVVVGQGGENWRYMVVLGEEFANTSCTIVCWQPGSPVQTQRRARAHGARGHDAALRLSGFRRRRHARKLGATVGAAGADHAPIKQLG
jgi:hypothetical protein